MDHKGDENESCDCDVPSLGERAMTREELAELVRDTGGIFLAERFDYSLRVAYDHSYYSSRFPGFQAHDIDVLVRYEQGIRAKQHKAILKKIREQDRPRKRALVAIERFKGGVSPF